MTSRLLPESRARRCHQPTQTGDLRVGVWGVRSRLGAAPDCVRGLSGACADMPRLCARPRTVDGVCRRVWVRWGFVPGAVALASGGRVAQTWRPGVFWTVGEGDEWGRPRCLFGVVSWRRVGLSQVRPGGVRLSHTGPHCADPRGAFSGGVGVFRPASGCVPETLGVCPRCMALGVGGRRQPSCDCCLATRAQNPTLSVGARQKHASSGLFIGCPLPCA